MPPPHPAIQPQPFQHKKYFGSATQHRSPLTLLPSYLLVNALIRDFSNDCISFHHVLIEIHTRGGRGFNAKDLFVDMHMYENVYEDLVANFRL